MKPVDQEQVDRKTALASLKNEMISALKILAKAAAYQMKGNED